MLICFAEALGTHYTSLTHFDFISSQSSFSKKHASATANGRTLASRISDSYDGCSITRYVYSILARGSIYSVAESRVNESDDLNKFKIKGNSENISSPYRNVQVLLNVPEQIPPAALLAEDPRRGLPAAPRADSASVHRRLTTPSCPTAPPPPLALLLLVGLVHGRRVARRRPRHREPAARTTSWSRIRRKGTARALTTTVMDCGFIFAAALPARPILGYGRECSDVHVRQPSLSLSLSLAPPGFLRARALRSRCTHSRGDGAAARCARG